MPRELTATVNLHHRSSLIGWVLVIFSAFTRSDNSLMFKQQNSVIAGSFSNFCVNTALLIQTFSVVHIVRGKTHALNNHGHAYYLSTAGEG